MKNSLTVFFTLISLSVFAQNNLSLQRSLQWAPEPYLHTAANDEVIEVWKFEGCSFSDLAPALPLYSERFALDGRASITAEIVSAQFESFGKKPHKDDAAVLSNEIRVVATVEQERNRFFGRVKFYPIRSTGSGFERVTSFTLNIRITPAPVEADERGGPHTYTSALSSGNLYKFGITLSAVYRLDYNYLKNELKIADLDNIDPRSIRLFGNGGAMLPEKTDDPRPDDLTENAIFVAGESDGKFDAGDYILFYATGPSVMNYRPSSTDPELSVRNNLYDTHAWYFIKTGDGQGLRVQETPSVAASYVTEEFDDFQRIEDDKVNLLDFSTSAQGSGKRWFGDYFYQTRQRNYEMRFPNIVSGSTARAKLEFAGRCDVNSTVRLIADGSTFSRGVTGVDVANNEASFAAGVSLSGSFVPDNDVVNLTLDYPEVSQTSEGWLDYIEVNARRRLIMTDRMMWFRDLKTLTQETSTFRLTGANPGLIVWDITAPQSPAIQGKIAGNQTVEFGANTLNVLRQYVAFFDEPVLPKPDKSIGKIANQNLHSTENVHMAIIYHPDFEAQANQLAEHRRTFSGLDVALVNIEQLYNEFSSGGKDPTAIRDFARMLLDRNSDKFEYLLLFGDGSFDPKNNSESDDNRDFIPVFETLESYHPIYAFPSDDYFALLSDGESGLLDGALDIAVGRITAGTVTEAQAVVDKIIAYDNNPATLGDWRLRLLYMADDEDYNAHINQADDLGTLAENTEKWFNIEKIYFDAYQQVATSGGQRFPDAKSAINSNIFKGALIAQYIGHGGPRGWAQERVIDNNDIAGWENPYRYPLIITATCSFGGYDDYTTLTGGEQALHKANAGAVALFTTVRAVYIDGNDKLTDAVQKVIFKKVNGRYRAIGDILKDAKNTLSSIYEDNARRFTLLGDPAMFLALPEYRVATTKINGNPINPAQPDTLKALMEARIEGVVTDTLGNLLPDFNGKIYVSIFDKKQLLQTLGQDPKSNVRTFSVQRNLIFKGLATVSNGRFSIKFVVPKDINYAYGYGKISYYAENGTPLDAGGASSDFIIGGNAGQIKDDKPPLVQVFLNTDAFVFGGITDKNPKILVKCADDFGMNVTGASLGHDLTAVLDDNIQATIVLNDFYQSEQDSSNRGTALYPLRNLAEGKHTLRVKGWDIANNPGEGYTEFYVAEDGQAALKHVLNYPNPFTTNTYFQFEHNLAGQMLDVQIHIFSVSGKLVKTIQHTAPAEGFRVTDIQWNGRDEYGDPLARGVYIYRVKVRGTDLNGKNVNAESDFEKLVILK